MTDWEQTPNGEIGEPGIGFTEGNILRVVALGLTAWVVVGVAVVTAVRAIHWIFRG